MVFPYWYLSWTFGDFGGITPDLDKFELSQFFWIKKSFEDLITAMQIIIRTLTGRKQEFSFEEESSVLDVKQALQEKEGIEIAQIR